MVKKYIPQRGDIVFVSFDPSLGSEQAGSRPALVVSNSFYNSQSGLALICPITSQIKHYPFEILLPKNIKTNGVILVDQIKCLDWEFRSLKKIEKIDTKTMELVIKRLNSLVSE